MDLEGPDLLPPDLGLFLLKQDFESINDNTTINIFLGGKEFALHLYVELLRVRVQSGAEGLLKIPEPGLLLKNFLGARARGTYLKL